MTQIKKKLAKRSAIIFIAAMLFFTFASRTIHYFMTPKVIASPVERGYINSTYSISDIFLYSENQVQISFPFEINEPLKIQKFHLSPGDTIEKYAPFVSFQPYNYNELIKEMEKITESKRIELMEFNKNLKDRINQLNKDIYDYSFQITDLEKEIASKCINDDLLKNKNKEIIDLKNKVSEQLQTVKNNDVLYKAGSISKADIDKASKELEQYKKDLEQSKTDYTALQNKLIKDTEIRLSDAKYKKNTAENSLKYINDTGILNCKTENSIRLEYEQLKNQLEIIKNSVNNNYTLLSPVSGTVGYIHPESEYKGIDILASVIPVDEQPLYAVNIDKDSLESLEPDTACTLKTGTTDNFCNIKGVQSFNGKDYIILALRGTNRQPVSGISSQNVQLLISGNFHNVIIPNTAFIGEDEVFILKTQNGFFGEEYYVSKYKVIVGEYNEQYSAITSGLNSQDIVVTGWDRQLEDGCRVMLPLD